MSLYIHSLQPLNLMNFQLPQPFAWTPIVEKFLACLVLISYFNLKNTLIVDATGLNSTTHQTPIPRKYLAYTASFSRQHTLKQVLDFLLARLRLNKEDMRLWKYVDEVK